MAYPTQVPSSKPGHFELAWSGEREGSNAGSAALTGAPPQPPIDRTEGNQKKQTPYNNGYSYTYIAAARLP